MTDENTAENQNAAIPDAKEPQDLDASPEHFMREREKKLAEMRRRGFKGCLYGCPEPKELVSVSLSRTTDILNYD